MRKGQTSKRAKRNARRLHGERTRERGLVRGRPCSSGFGLTRRFKGKDTGVPVIGAAVVQDQVNGVHLVDLERKEKTNLHTGDSLGGIRGGS